ncbi:hypothetical protein L0U85_03055 [Glycomyces sp. L485]|uniref:hypothetical protein n=1 Tax=Glycomyces sp. L485 TaxID=2909235 RepID=UPI001F4A2FAF|nr:hypothetical protein [Glycomyces sp. L485]MCH7229842.1 hypothetical protein [Glycomyces sp. L485]
MDDSGRDYRPPSESPPPGTPAPGGYLPERGPSPHGGPPFQARRQPKQPLPKAVLWVIAGAIAAVMFTVGVVTGGVLYSPKPGEVPIATEPTTSAEETVTGEPSLEPETDDATLMLDAALTECAEGSEFFRLGDNGRTIIGEGIAAEDNADDSVEELACILGFLGASEADLSHISSTRAIDGRQEAEFGSYLAAWTYGPDSGLHMTITVNE